MMFLLALVSLVARIGDPPPPAGGARRFRSQVTSIEELMAAMDMVHQRLEERWTRWFSATYITPAVEDQPMQKMAYSYVHPNDDGSPATVETTCNGDGGGGPRKTIASDEPNALFCENDSGHALDGSLTTGVVYIPIEPLFAVLQGNIWSTEYPMRDTESAVGEQLLLFAATLVAHESGHGVQNAYQTQTGDSYPPGPTREQFADCVAGDLIATIEDEILSEAADPKMVEAIRMAGFAAIGDMIPVGDGGQPIDRANRFRSHGYAEERLAAFQRGYQAAKAGGDTPTSICFDWYPPGDPA